MRKSRDVRAARCNSWLHYGQGGLTAEPCQKEDLFAASHRQKMAAAREAGAET